MAKAELSAVFRQLRGQVGEYVFRQVRGKLVVSRAPDWSRRKRTEAQKASARAFGQAARRTRSVLANAKDKAAYKAKAAQRRVPLMAAVMGDLLSQAKKGSRKA